MDKNDIIWWPDDQKGLIINAITARDRASWRFLGSRAARMVLPPLAMVAVGLFANPQLRSGAPVGFQRIFGRGAEGVAAFVLPALF